jgi:hypothetical protein
VNGEFAVDDVTIAGKLAGKVLRSSTFTAE